MSPTNTDVIRIPVAAATMIGLALAGGVFSLVNWTIHSDQVANIEIVRNNEFSKQQNLFAERMNEFTKRVNDVERQIDILTERQRPPTP